MIQTSDTTLTIQPSTVVLKKRTKRMARTKSDSFSRTVKFYNDNFNIVDKKVEGKVFQAQTLEEALNLIGDADAQLSAVNSFLREKQIVEAMNAATGGMEERFILGFIRPMRSIAPFNTMPSETAEDEKKIVAAILEQVKAVPFLLVSLKSYCEIKSKEGSEE